jgi:glycosyltransferase involved in cell wall biosynthesis
LFVVGRDNPETFRAALSKGNLGEGVRFLAPRADVEFFYAAADLYAGPSLEDTFALPAAEAMACGLPVIISGRAGAATFVSHGISGLVLADPTDAKELSAMIRDLYEHEELRRRMGERAAEAVRPYTWERSAKEMQAVFDEILSRKENAEIPEKAAAR